MSNQRRSTYHSFWNWMFAFWLCSGWCLFTLDEKKNMRNWIVVMRRYLIVLVIADCFSNVRTLEYSKAVIFKYKKLSFFFCGGEIKADFQRKISWSVSGDRWPPDWTTSLEGGLSCLVMVKGLCSATSLWCSSSAVLFVANKLLFLPLLLHSKEKGKKALAGQRQRERKHRKRGPEVWVQCKRRVTTNTFEFAISIIIHSLQWRRTRTCPSMPDQFSSASTVIYTTLFVSSGKNPVVRNQTLRSNAEHSRYLTASVLFSSAPNCPGYLKHSSNQLVDSDHSSGLPIYAQCQHAILMKSNDVLAIHFRSVNKCS